MLLNGKRDYHRVDLRHIGHTGEEVLHLVYETPIGRFYLLDYPTIGNNFDHEGTGPFPLFEDAEFTLKPSLLITAIRAEVTPHAR